MGGAVAAAPTPASGWASLTPAEAKVANSSLRPDQSAVGERMFISAHTVKTHVTHIFSKLDVHSRAELTARVVRREAG